MKVIKIVNPNKVLHHKEKDFCLSFFIYMR